MRTFATLARSTMRIESGWKLIIVVLLLLAHTAAEAQQRARDLSGYERYQQVRRAMARITSGVREGALEVTWNADGSSFEYERNGKMYRYDIAGRREVPLVSPATQPVSRPMGGRVPLRARDEGAGRGRQMAVAYSPDRRMRAVYRDHNVYISGDSGGEIAVTTDGSAAARLSYGTADWVYGEELFQHSAMWWSPDGAKLAFYRFDEKRVPEFYLGLNQTKRHDTLDAEPYPMPGDPNPIVDLLIYDLRSRQTVRVDVRDGRPFDDSTVGHYVYQVAWSADGRKLLFDRTNRRQNVMEFVAANPADGSCRVIVHEAWPQSWVENLPEMRFLQDGRRFIWASQRSGFKNYYLYQLDGRLLATLTENRFDADQIAGIDEKGGTLFYLAHDGDNPMKLQLHRVSLNGLGDKRLTDPAFLHTVDVAPDGAHFIDISQTHNTPPVTRLMDAEGNQLAELAKSDLKPFNDLHLLRSELFSFKAADGQADLYGLLEQPSSFDAFRRYPLLVSVYAGPETNGARERFVVPNPLTELGFLVASIDSRSAAGRGKKLLDSIYLNLGQGEIDDQAAGVRSLFSREYVDKNRVGIFGTSYGGYASVMCLLRYPDVFRAACASSPPTDWRNYDTIYTERYMWLPRENPSGYEAGSAITYVGHLQGRLILYYGTADNNVHPSNTLQLVAALQRAGKSFDLQVGPDRGHSGINQERMVEFFVDSLGKASMRPLGDHRGPGTEDREDAKDAK